MMGQRVENYAFIDEEGDEVRFNYVTRWCMCACDCYSDEIELFEGGSEIPYRLDVEGSEMKWLIKGLIDGGIKPSLLTNHKEGNEK
jgi:hypothetical protein